MYLKIPMREATSLDGLREVRFVVLPVCGTDEEEIAEELSKQIKMKEKMYLRVPSDVFHHSALLEFFSSEKVRASDVGVQMETTTGEAAVQTEFEVRHSSDQTEAVASEAAQTQTGSSRIKDMCTQTVVVLDLDIEPTRSTVPRKRVLDVGTGSKKTEESKRPRGDKEAEIMTMVASPSVRHRTQPTTDESGGDTVAGIDEQVASLHDAPADVQPVEDTPMETAVKVGAAAAAAVSEGGEEEERMETEPEPGAIEVKKRKSEKTLKRSQGRQGTPYPTRPSLAQIAVEQNRGLKSTVVAREGRKMVDVRLDEGQEMVSKKKKKGVEPMQLVDMGEAIVVENNVVSGGQNEKEKEKDGGDEEKGRNQKRMKTSVNNCTKCKKKVARSGMTPILWSYHMRQHVLKHHTDLMPYHCSFCRIRHREKNEVAKHVKKCHGTATLIVNPLLEATIEKTTVDCFPHHYQQAAVSADVIQHCTCARCGEEMESERKADHIIKAHLNEKVWHCSYCSVIRLFFSEEDRESHLRSSHKTEWDGLLEEPMNFEKHPSAIMQLYFPN